MQTLLGYSSMSGDIEIVKDLIARPGIDLSLGVRHVFSRLQVHGMARSLMGRGLGR